jgi:hypothetical protein
VVSRDACFATQVVFQGGCLAAGSFADKDDAFKTGMGPDMGGSYNEGQMSYARGEESNAICLRHRNRESESV